jgi:hypothetical protein
MIVFSWARVLRQIAVKSMSNYAYTHHSAIPQIRMKVTVLGKSAYLQVCAG